MASDEKREDDTRTANSDPAPAATPAAERAAPARRRWPIALLAVALMTTLGVFLATFGGGTALGRHPEAAPAATGDGRLTLELAGDRRAVLLGGDGLVRLELKLQGKAAAGPGVRQPTDFVVVLDHSGSMADFDKIIHAREAVSGLIDRLDPDDRFALVIYNDHVEVPIPLAPASPAVRARWKNLVAEVGPIGGTNLSIGLDSGLGVFTERRRTGAARMVLISDGLANLGDTSRDGLLRRATQGANLAAPLTAIGVGDDFDENLMGSLADAGGGNFYFLRDAVALAQVFEGELGATRETIAELVEIEIETAPGVVLVDAAGYPVERQGKIARFRPGSLFAGQDRRIWLTLKVEARELGARELGRVAARYRAENKEFQLAGLPAPQIEQVKDEAAFLAAIDRERWSRAVVEEDYGKLQQTVAEHVKACRRDAAKGEITAYTGKFGKLNAGVKSREVTQSLDAAHQLAAMVDDAFVGADQHLKQNSLSKTNQSAGWDARRAGAKKLPSPKPPSPPSGGGG